MRQLVLDPPAVDRGRRWGRFTRHYLEMVVAMAVGMGVLGILLRVALVAAGIDYLVERHPELASLEMAFTMSAGMGAWMRYRGHGWAGVLQMSAAMFTPAVALFPLLWLNLIGGEAVMTVMHIAMLPLMLVVMLLHRSEYLGVSRP
jgi:hypothetical protein